jgi:hypothetical protein
MKRYGYIIYKLVDDKEVPLDPEPRYIYKSLPHAKSVASIAKYTNRLNAIVIRDTAGIFKHKQ